VGTIINAARAKTRRTWPVGPSLSHLECERPPPGLGPAGRKARQLAIPRPPRQCIISPGH